MPRRAALALAALTLVASAACVKRGTTERPLLTGIEFRGNAHESDSHLREAIQSEPTSRLPFSGTRQYEGAVVAADAARIERYYRARGFYEAKITSTTLHRGSRGRARLEFAIDEGEPSRVATLAVTGLEALPVGQQRFVTKTLPLREGDILDESAFDGSTEILEQRLQSLGYFAASATKHADVDGGTHGVAVTFEIAPGERADLGEIEIEGNRFAGAAALRRATGLRSGMTMDPARLASAQANLYDLGVFRAVALRTGEPSNGRRPVIFEVRESPNHRASLGAGVGTDGARQSSFVTAGWRVRDLFGSLERFDLTAKAGYAALPDATRRLRTGPIFSAEAVLQRPAMFAPHLLATARARVDHGPDPLFDRDTADASAGSDLKLGEFSLGAGAGLEGNRFRNLQTTLAPAALGALAFDPCPQGCADAYLQPRAIWDHRDDVIAPHNGWYFAAIAEAGSRIRGDSVRYVRIQPEFRFYLPLHIFAHPSIIRSSKGLEIPLGGPRVVAFRLRSGLLAANGNSPVERRFFAGGPDSQRGFATGRLAPLAAGIGGHAVPLGGESLVEASSEVRWYLNPQMIALGFVDGAAADRGTRAITSPRMQWAVGPGLEYIGPLGIVRADAGFRIDATNLPTIGTGVSGHEPPWALHVSLGEAF